MKKELSAREYVTEAKMLLNSANIVASNLAFNAAGLAAGEEEVHRKKLLMSLVDLRIQVEGLLSELADKDEVADVEHELAKKVIEVFLNRFKKEAGE